MALVVVYKNNGVVIQLDGYPGLMLTPEQARQLHVGLAQDCPECPIIGGRDRCPCIQRYIDYCEKGSRGLPSFSAPRS